MLLVAGCGGGGEEPRIERDLAGELATQSLRAAAEIDVGNFCNARTAVLTMQERTIGAINSGRIPGELQEELLGSVNALAESVTCTPPAAREGSRDEAQDLADWLRERSD